MNYATGWIVTTILLMLLKFLLIVVADSNFVEDENIFSAFFVF